MPYACDQSLRGTGQCLLQVSLHNMQTAHNTWHHANEQGIQQVRVEAHAAL